MLQIPLFNAYFGAELIKEVLQFIRIKMIIDQRVVLPHQKIEGKTFTAGFIAVSYKKIGIKTAQDIHRSAADIIICPRQIVPADITLDDLASRFLFCNLNHRRTEIKTGVRAKKDLLSGKIAIQVAKPASCIYNREVCIINT